MSHPLVNPMGNLELDALQEQDHAVTENDNEAGNDQNVLETPPSQVDQHPGTASTQNSPGSSVGQSAAGVHQPSRPTPSSHDRNRLHHSVSANDIDHMGSRNHKSCNRVEKAKAKRQEQQRKARNRAIEARLQLRARRHSTDSSKGVDPILLQLTLDNILREGARPKFETASERLPSVDSPGEANYDSDGPYRITVDPALCPGTSSPVNPVNLNQRYRYRSIRPAPPSSIVPLYSYNPVQASYHPVHGNTQHLAGQDSVHGLRSDTSTSQIAAAGNPPSHAANANQRNGGYTTGPFALRGETQYQSLGYTADNQDSGLDGM